jgi:squalene-hopene/tetraprenyl-beta-curcumene cyclase
MISPDRVAAACETVRGLLLAERDPSGHWSGELSTSALSTATAVMACETIRRDARRTGRRVARLDGAPVDLDALIRGGLEWLAAHPNADGGWGDTLLSRSNISTTMLARAVFRATGTEDEPRFAPVVRAACDWIDKAGGVPAVLARYGRDRTFSIPILTHCALAGLVDWGVVLPLPFELACLPARFYKTVRLPVVSYALPALIAIGQVRHHFRRPWNPLTRLLRAWARQPSLDVLERIQPSNGGFLEAAPLTSFVTMSLAGMGLSGHPVARKGLDFLVASVRDDGSWPIDTNLATWTTTLSVAALGADLPAESRGPIRAWLLGQQYRTVHPYTNADPGGWAWTDLPGGVPDADDTPGAMLALMQLAPEASGGREPPGSSSCPSDSAAIADAVARGAHWLLGLQNRDGGFPTFCRGWGALPFDRSSPDITAHCLRALAAGMAARGRPFRTDGGGGYRLWLGPLDRWWRAIEAGFLFLDRVQRADGSWLPLWFGNQHAPDDENPTYGTARVLAAYRDCGRLDSPAARRGLAWLEANRNDDGGWGGGRGIASTVEETALAAEILTSVAPESAAAREGIAWLVRRVEAGRIAEPSPIGFYFAKLWYFERLYPPIFALAALRRARGSQEERAGSLSFAESECVRS